MRSAMNGSLDAFESLYRWHTPRLMAVAWRLAGGDRARAEDWVQDAFIQAWNKLSQLREPAAFGGWIRQLLINQALMDKRRARLAPVNSSAAGQGPTMEQAAPAPPWPCMDRDLEAAIAALPDRARMVLVLFHLEGLGHKEIGTLLGVTSGTSKAQLHRARQLIKERLKP